MAKTYETSWLLKANKMKLEKRRFLKKKKKKKIVKFNFVRSVHTVRQKNITAPLSYFRIIYACSHAHLKLIVIVYQIRSTIALIKATAVITTMSSTTKKLSRNVLQTIEQLAINK